MSEKLNFEVIEAAGGIIECATSEGPLVAVAYRERYGGEWGLPKGKRQAGESWQKTALREVREETGLAPDIVDVAGATAYLADGVPKIVLYWRMRVDRAAEPFVPNEEVTKLVWLTPAQAAERLTHREEADLVRRIFEHSGAKIVRAMAFPRAPKLRRQRWQRLNSAIIAYGDGLRGRAKLSRKLASSLTTIQPVLNSASTALEIGDIDGAWKCFHTAQQLELLYLDTDQLNVAAMAIRAEADKLYGWRKAAVDQLLTVKEGENHKPERVLQAAVIRDQHYDNEVYKDGLRRNNNLRFAVVLLLVLAALLGLSWLGYLSSASQSNEAAMLLSVAIFGLLGSTISATTAMSKPPTTSRIPEMVSSIHVTALRLLVGPASAILLYFVAQTDLYKHLFKFGPTPDDHYAILVIAFAAGFSERLVLRVVEAITGKT
jgi:8-oxo-dGTP diphosphatase